MAADKGVESKGKNKDSRQEAFDLHAQPRDLASALEAMDAMPEESVADIEAWAARFGPDVAAEARTLLGRLSAPRAAFAGLTFERPLVMGVINVTPDSFSDGGDFYDPGLAIEHGLGLLEQGE